MRLLKNIAAALPEITSRGNKTIREACLTLHEDGSWSVMAGGHLAVHIGEWGGDFSGEGNTSENAIENCMKNIQFAYKRNL